MLLANCGGACCLTGIVIPALLTASHIKPWAAATPSERLMSSNGIPLNALHDRAFDRGLITLDDRYRVVVSSRAPHTPTNDQWLYAFDGREIAPPGSDEYLAEPRAHPLPPRLRLQAMRVKNRQPADSHTLKCSHAMRYKDPWRASVGTILEIARRRCRT